MPPFLVKNRSNIVVDRRKKGIYREGFEIEIERLFIVS